jgi:hypothetical protein
MWPRRQSRVSNGLLASTVTRTLNFHDKSQPNDANPAGTPPLFYSNAHKRKVTVPAWSSSLKPYWVERLWSAVAICQTVWTIHQRRQRTRDQTTLIKQRGACRKGKFFSSPFYPTSSPYNSCSSSLIGYIEGHFWQRQNRKLSMVRGSKKVYISLLLPFSGIFFS